MQRLTRILLAGIAIMAMGLASCASDGGDTVSAGKRLCTEVQQDLDKAEATQTDRAGTPDEEAAKQKVADLKKELESCDDGSDETTTTEAETTTSTTTTTEPDISADDVVNQINSVFEGFNPGELSIGTENVEFEGAPEERGIAAFSQETLRTPEEVGNFLNADSDVSRAAKLRVAASILDAGYGDEELNRAYSGEGYFPIQMKVASQILGTTYYHDGQVLEAGEWRQVQDNDVIWLFMTTDGKIIFGAAVRADCANPNLTKVVPVRPGMPVAPPIEAGPKPKCPPDLPNGYWDEGQHKWICKDSPSEGSLDPSNPNHRPGGTGVEEGGSDEGLTEAPAGTPGPTHTNPEPPAATPVRPTNPPGTPTAPTTTTAPPNNPEEQLPVNTTTPPIDGF